MPSFVDIYLVCVGARKSWERAQEDVLGLFKGGEGGISVREKIQVISSDRHK